MTQVPPIRNSSATIAFAPCPAAMRAARTPPDPAPMTKRSTSKFVMTLKPLTETCEAGAGARRGAEQIRSCSPSSSFPRADARACRWTACGASRCRRCRVPRGSPAGTPDISCPSPLRRRPASSRSSCSSRREASTRAISLSTLASPLSNSGLIASAVSCSAVCISGWIAAMLRSSSPSIEGTMTSTDCLRPMSTSTACASAMAVGRGLGGARARDAQGDSRDGAGPDHAFRQRGKYHLKTPVDLDFSDWVAGPGRRRRLRRSRRWRGR